MSPYNLSTGYICKVTGQSVNSEFSQQVVISVIRTLLSIITTEKHEIAQNLTVPLMLDDRSLLSSGRQFESWING